MRQNRDTERRQHHETNLLFSVRCCNHCRVAFLRRLWKHVKGWCENPIAARDGYPAVLPRFRRLQRERAEIGQLNRVPSHFQQSAPNVRHRSRSCTQRRRNVSRKRWQPRNLSDGLQRVRRCVARNAVRRRTNVQAERWPNPDDGRKEWTASHGRRRRKILCPS